MNKEKKPNRLQELNKDYCGAYFIQRYEILEITGLRPSQIKLIELVLSFQNNDQPFQMSYKAIAKRIGTKEDSVKVYVSQLKKSGLIITDNKKNFKKDLGKGGSRTAIKVQLDAIEKLIIEKTTGNIPDQISQPEPLQQVPAQPKEKNPTITQPTQEVATEVNNDNQMKYEEVNPKILNSVLNYLETKINGKGFPYDINEIVAFTSTEKNETKKCLSFLKELNVISLYKNEENFFISISKHNYSKVTGKKLPVDQKVIKMQTMQVNGTNIQIPSNQVLKSFNFREGIASKKLNIPHDLRMVYSFLEFQGGKVYVTPEMSQKNIGLSPRAYITAVERLLEKDLIQMDENGGIELTITNRKAI